MDDREPRAPRTLRYHSTAGARPMPAGQIIVVGLVMFTVAALLNADSLYAQASRQPFGWKRTALVTAARPVRWVSHVTHLNRPRADIQEAIGRDPIDTGGPATTATTVPPPKEPPVLALRHPTAAVPLRLWVGGDSMAQEIGTSVVEDGAALGTIDPTLFFYISSGLSRPDFFDWPKQFAEVVLPTKPEVMVVIFGANDAQPLQIPAGGPVFQVRDPEWQAEYRKRVASTMNQLAGNGRLVIWIGMPNMRKAEFSERMQILNGIYRSEAAKRPWVRFLDTRPLLAPKGGGYSDYLTDAAGEEHLARQSDGIHLSRYGADLVSDAVYELLDAEIAKAAGPTTTTTRPGVTTTTGDG